MVERRSVLACFRVSACRAFFLQTRVISGAFLVRRQFAFEVDGEPAQARDSVRQVDAQHDRLHALDGQGLSDHGLGSLHQGEQRAVGARLEELRAGVVVGEPLHVLLHPGEVLEDAALFGQPDARRGRDGHVLQQGRGLDLLQRGLGLGIEVSGELPQLVPSKVVEGEARPENASHDSRRREEIEWAPGLVNFFPALFTTLPAALACKFIATNLEPLLLVTLYSMYLIWPNADFWDGNVS